VSIDYVLPKSGTIQLTHPQFFSGFTPVHVDKLIFCDLAHPVVSRILANKMTHNEGCDVSTGATCITKLHHIKLTSFRSMLASQVQVGQLSQPNRAAAAVLNMCSIWLLLFIATFIPL